MLDLHLYFLPLAISIITASHPRVPPLAIAAWIAARYLYISYLCGPSAIVPISVAITDMSTPKQDIAVAEAGTGAQTAMKIAAVKTAEYFIVAPLVKTVAQTRIKSPTIERFLVASSIYFTRYEQYSSWLPTHPRPCWQYHCPTSGASRSLSLRLNILGVLTMDRNMEQFIHRENLAHYRRLLAEPSVASDPVRHKLLIRLLANQETKDAIPDGQ